MIKKQKAFSLVELMTVIAIIAILAAIASTTYSGFTTRARSKQGFSALIELKSKQEQFRARNLTYATTLAQLPGYDSDPQNVGDHFQLRLTASAANSFTAQASDTLKSIGGRAAGSDVWEITNLIDQPVQVSRGY